MKALLIHADGQVEELRKGDAEGKYIMRPPPPCKECGALREGVTRKFVAHFASNHLTIPSGRLAYSEGAERNSGTIVYIEEPA